MERGIMWVMFFVVPVGAWLQHVITCISDDRWGFLIAGAILAPVAVIHGIGIWLGFF